MGIFGIKMGIMGKNGDYGVKMDIFGVKMGILGG